MNDAGQSVPVTIIRPNGWEQSPTTWLVVRLVRVWMIRRALRRFFPDNDFSYRDVMVAVGAIRLLQVSDNYVRWTKDSLNWTEKMTKRNVRLSQMMEKWQS